MSIIASNEPGTYFIQLNNGRKIAFREYGLPGGRPVFYFHGSPGSRFEPSYSGDAGEKYDYRIFAIDRPGIGMSDYYHGRKLLDWPIDIIEIADQLGLEKFGLIGASGGGPYVLACAHQIPERLDFSVVMGSWAPVASAGLWGELAPLDRFFGKLSGKTPFLFYIPFSSIGISARVLPPSLFIKTLGSSMCNADLELLKDHEMAIFFTHDVKESFRQGVRGPADDAIILYQDWGFKVEEIKIPVHIFHGEKDKFAPYSFGEYLDGAIPNATLHSYPGEGHLFLVHLFDEIFEYIKTQP